MSAPTTERARPTVRSGAVGSADARSSGVRGALARAIVARLAGRAAPTGSAARAARAAAPTGGSARGRSATGTAQRGSPSSSRAATIPTQRGAPSVERGTATSRAYARRNDRLRRVVGGRAPRGAPSAGRAKFVLLVMALLGTGLVLTLWLSTAAAADSYRLQDARSAARALSEQSEQLRREVTAMDAAPALAQRAAELGMVPVQDSARLVVAPDGSVTVAGTPKAAIATAPPAPPPASSNGAASSTPTATPTATPNGTDPNSMTADAVAAAGGPTTTASTPTSAPNGQESRAATATARAGASTSAPNGQASRAATATPRASATTSAVATSTRTPKPTPTARPSGTGGGVGQ